ncbi:MAG: flavodoxin family protein [Anaerolineae bacterium]|nr:flavodoxin family protein [Anaerolineae bacterium]
MKALVVYDSVFGNTEKVAQAMGEALSARADVETRRVADTKPADLTGVDVLVVGSPTRAFSPTPDTKKLLNAIPAKGLQGTKVAAFDTRISVEKTNNAFLSFMVSIFGYAAKPIAKRLTRKGGTEVMAPEGFFVEGTEGPLTEGELERAKAWVTQIV